MREGILAAGNFIVDRVKLIDDYPAQDTLASILSETPSNGGGPYNILTDLARMGVTYPLEAAGMIGDDADGKWILEHCARHGIATAQLRKSAELPTSYTDVMTVQATGRRTFFHQRGANAGFTGGQLDFSQSGARIFHLGYLLLLDYLDIFSEDGRTQASHLLERASGAGMTTSIDLVSAAHAQFGEIVESSLPHADYLFLNEIEAGNLLGSVVNAEVPSELEQAARAIVRKGVRRVVTLHTEKHAVSATVRGEVHHEESLVVPVEEIAGANGAGDAFAAGFLHAIHEGLEMPAALSLAVKIAAQCLRHPTPSGGIETMS